MTILISNPGGDALVDASSPVRADDTARLSTSLQPDQSAHYGDQLEGFSTSSLSVDAPASELRGIASPSALEECAAPPTLDPVASAGAVRSHEYDARIAAHESGHVVVTRANGASVCGATISPGDDYGGMVWSTPEASPSAMKYSIIDDDAESVESSRRMERNMKPPVGETNAYAPHIFEHVHRRVVELMAGNAAEIVMHPDLAPLHAASDLIKARALASIICGSEASIDAFLAFALQEAISIITRYRHIAEALADALIRERTITGDQIETIIHTSNAAKVAREERERREAWRKTTARVAAKAMMFEPMNKGRLL